MSSAATVLFLLSGALIGTGVTMLVRDSRNRKRAAGRGEARDRAPAVPAQREAALTALSPLGAQPRQGEGAGAEAEALPASFLPIEDPAHETGWTTFAARIIPALRAVNGAFAQTGAQVVPSMLEHGESGDSGRGLTLSIELGDAQVGHMRLVLRGHEIEMQRAVAERDRGVPASVRRLDPRTANIQMIAEAIAACAWPVIARHRMAASAIAP